MNDCMKFVQHNSVQSRQRRNI